MGMLNAKYTMCFKDVYTIKPSIFNDMMMSTTARTDKLIGMLKAKYDLYEISGETIQEFQLFLTNKFLQYVDYYEQLLNAYDAEFDWQDGDVETFDLTEEHDDTSTLTPRTKRETTVTPQNDATSDEYDLPRSASAENRPSGRTISRDSTVKTESQVTEGTDEVHDVKEKTNTGNRKLVNLVEQRKKYLDSVRNLYLEFADRFKPCFIQIFN